MEKVKIINHFILNDSECKKISVSTMRFSMNFDDKQLDEDIIEYVKEILSINDYNSVSCEVCVYVNNVKDVKEIDYNIELCCVSGLLAINIYVENKFLFEIRRYFEFNEPKVIGGKNEKNV